METLVYGLIGFAALVGVAFTIWFILDLWQGAFTPFPRHHGPIIDRFRVFGLSICVGAASFFAAVMLVKASIAVGEVILHFI